MHGLCMASLRPPVQTLQVGLGRHPAPSRSSQPTGLLARQRNVSCTLLGQRFLLALICTLCRWQQMCTCLFGNVADSSFPCSLFTLVVLLSNGCNGKAQPFPHQAIKSFISVKCDINEVEKRTSTKIVISRISNRCILLLQKCTFAFTFSLPLVGKLTLSLDCLFSVYANIHCLFRLLVVHLCPGSLSLHL